MGASQHEETERKYAVERDTRVPTFAEVHALGAVDPPVTSHLEAVYFDTADLDLLQHGVTVRRRTGGDDEGWHLKKPSGQDTRTETRVPLGRAGTPVPQRLHRMVEPITGSQPLVPVARVVTDRSEEVLRDANGTPMARFCDDDVHAERLLVPTLRQHWREWEVELVHGHHDLLDHLEQAVLAAGARPATASSKAARALAAGTDARGREPRRPSPPDRRSDAGEVLRAYLAGPVSVLQDGDTGQGGATVHQLRIAARRIRSALASYAPVFEPGAVDPIREELRWLGQSLGAARDVDVLARHLDAMIDDELDRPTGLAAQRLHQRITRELEGAHRTGLDAAKHALTSERYHQLVRSLQAVVESPALLPAASTRARAVLPTILERDARRVRRAVRAARRADPGPVRDLALHEVRKKVKRLRYSAESAAPALGKRATALARWATTLQEALGDHQDTVSSRAWLQALAERADGEAAVAFGAGRLHAREEERAGSAERDYEKALRHPPSKRVDGWFRDGRG